jgi:hypothetical protein
VQHYTSIFKDLHMRLLTPTSLLVLALASLLFAQWPLREWFHVYTRQANDLGQLIFAVYIAVAVYAASRTHTHISPQTKQVPPIQSQARWEMYLQWVCVVPWTAWMAWSWWAEMLHSAVGLERFADSNLPGYFVLKIALFLMVLLLALDYSRQAWRALRSPA